MLRIPLAASILLATATSACSGPPPRSEAIDAAIARALAVEGNPSDPAREALRASVDRARRLEAREEGGRWRFWERPHEARAAWHESARKAWLYTRTARERERGLAATWALERSAAQRSLVEARRLAERLGGAWAAAELQSLEGAVLRADRWAAQGETARALSILGSHRPVASLRDAADEAEQRFHDPQLRALWSSWVASTLTASGTMAVVLVDKQRRRLEVFRDGESVASFAAELGSGDPGRKLYSGDKTTPEGLYRVTEVRRPGATRYHRALMLDYPNREDRERFRRARERGEVPPGASIGGLIEVHGHGGSGRNWTDGCVALANEDMDRLVDLVGVGTPVTIVGTVP